MASDPKRAERDDSSAVDSERDGRRPGEIVGRKYEVLELVAHGATGSVYRVRETTGIVTEPLVMKVLYSAFSNNSELRDHFIEEIRGAMKLVNKHIVQTRDVGLTADGRIYYTMDHVDGRSLADVLREEKRLDPGRSLHIAWRILRALLSAHKRGIVHGHVRPAHVMLLDVDGKETVRVLDFGIASALQRKPRDGRNGSPPYMSPEQLAGRRGVSFPSDVYSVGVVLYECLSGCRPYAGETAAEVYENMKTKRRPPVEELVAGLEAYPGLTLVVHKALKRNPEKRFPSAKEFFDEINAVLERLAAERAAAARRAASRERLHGSVRGAGPGKRRAAAAHRPASGDARDFPWLELIATLVVLLTCVGIFLLLRNSATLEEPLEPRQEGRALNAND